jgi:AraC-like DNA-binding protein
MHPPYWNESLARLLESRRLYALDSQRLDQTRLHSQPGLELNYTCEGRGSLLAGNKTFALAAGTLVLVPDSVPHRLEVHTPGRYVRSVLCLAPGARQTDRFAALLHDMLRQDPFREPCCLYLDEVAGRMVRDLISRISVETSRQAAWWQDLASALACELLASSARWSTRPRPLQPPGSRLAEEVAAYVSFHLEDDLTLKKVAGHFGVTREHLSRVFRQHFSITYQRYVINRRIASACSLLMENNHGSLLEIALRTGFQSHSSFSRVFRQQEGVSPSQFRSLHHIGS